MRRGPQRFSSRKSPARPTAILDSYKSGEAHRYDRTAKVRRAWRRSGTGTCNPARRQMKSGETHCTHELASEFRRRGRGRREGKRKKRKRKRKRKRKDVLIKSNNPHLAGGEKIFPPNSCIHHVSIISIHIMCASIHHAAGHDIHAWLDDSMDAASLQSRLQIWSANGENVRSDKGRPTSWVKGAVADFSFSFSTSISRKISLLLAWLACEEKHASKTGVTVSTRIEYRFWWWGCLLKPGTYECSLVWMVPSPSLWIQTWTSRRFQPFCMPWPRDKIIQPNLNWYKIIQKNMIWYNIPQYDIVWYDIV